MFPLPNQSESATYIDGGKAKQSTSHPLMYRYVAGNQGEMEGNQGELEGNHGSFKGNNLEKNNHQDK